MTSKVRVASHIMAGAFLAFPLVGSAPVWAQSGDKPNSAAYPNAPGGTPAAGDAGKPVEPKGDAGSKPNPAGAAGTEGAKASTATPSTAYPGAPTEQPAAGAKP